MLIKENDLRRLIRRKLLEACVTPSERNPEADEAELRDIFDMLKMELEDTFDDERLKTFLDRTHLIVVKGPDDPNYKTATRNLGDTAAAIFRSLSKRSGIDKIDVMLRKAAHERGDHNTVYYHLYGPTDDLNCLDSEKAEEYLRHELEHFVDKMTLFTDENVIRSEDQSALISDIFSPSMWTGSGVPQNPPSSFKKKWVEKGGYASWTGSLSLTEEEDQAAMERFWEEIIVGQMKDVAEAYAVLMTAKKFIDGIGESITSLTRMDLGEIADLGGGEISHQHLIAIAIMAKDCGFESSCSDAWDLLY